jgi:hypothetical protein
MADQGTNRSSVYIETREVDLFNATSVVTSGNASCDNFKGYFTVSPTAGKGHFTTIASAVDALSNTGGTIVLKEGTHYTGDTSINMPAVDINIVGDGRDITKVVINNPYGEPEGFKIFGKSSSYVFRDFTASTTIASAPEYVIKCDLAGSPTAAPTLCVENILFKQRATPDLVAQNGVFYWGYGKLEVEQCEFDEGRRGVYARGKNLKITNNVFNALYNRNVFAVNNLASGTGMVIQGNTFENWKRNGILAQQCTGAIIADNTINMTTVTGDAVSILGSSNDQLFPIWVTGAKRCIITNNNLTLINASQFAPGVINYILGLVMTESQNCDISGNTMIASLNTDGNIYFLNAQSSIIGNTIVGNIADLRNVDQTAINYGLYANIDFKRNVVSDNVFALASSAGDYGFYMGSTRTAYNYGRGNLVYNAGADVFSSSASNDVAATLII